MSISEKERELRKARGLRARKIREELLRLSRPDIQRKYAIPTQTQQGWEDAKYGGINESAAQKLIEIYKTEGLTISVEYLMYGEGENPFKGDYWNTNFAFKNIQYSNEEIIAQELKVFHKYNQNAVHLIIKDDAFAPWLMPGDYVAGKWHFDDELESLTNYPCIVQTISGELFVRIMRSSNKPDLFDLSCLNSVTTAEKSTLENTKVISAAPIIWMRKVGFVPNF